MRVVTLRSAVCLLGRFPALAGADLDVDAGESCCSRGRTGPARPRCCGCAPGCCRCATGPPRCSAHDLARDRRSHPPRGRARRPRDLLLRRPDGRREPPVSRPGPPAGSRPRPTPRSNASASLGRAVSRTGGFRRAAPPALARDRACTRPRVAAARRTARRPRRARPARARRGRRGRARRRPHGVDRVARARTARGSRDARGADRRGPGARGAALACRRRRRPLREPPPRRRSSSRARTCASNGGHGSRCSRSCRSAGSSSCMFAFALDPDRGAARARAPGLFWAAVLLASLLAIGRAVRGRGSQRRARRVAALRARRRLDLPRQGRRDRGRAALLEVVLGDRRSSCCTTSKCAASCCSRAPRWPRPSGWRRPVRSTACSHRESGPAKRWSRCSCCRR